jgi:hypothetical protein
VSARQTPEGTKMGFLPPSPGSGSVTRTLNAANTWLALGYAAGAVPRTINKVQMALSAVAGTLAATDLRCDIYSDVSGKPNASLGNTTTISSTPAGAGFFEFSGLSVLETAGNQYWAVFRNLNGVPGTNFPTVRMGAQGTWTLVTASYGLAKWETTDGATWITSQLGGFGLRIGYSDGTYYGAPVSNTPTGLHKIFGSTWEGVQFTMPANETANVRGVRFYKAIVTGSPTGNLQANIIVGNNVYTTVAMPNQSAIVIAGYVDLDLATTVQIPGGSTVTILLNDTAADSSSNAYQLIEYDVDTNVNSLALMPMGGTFKRAFSTNAGVTISTDTSVIYPMSLILDSSGEYARQSRPRRIGL